MIKLFSFIVLTHFFHFNELKICNQVTYFFKLNQQYFFTVYCDSWNGSTFNSLPIICYCWWIVIQE